MKFIIRETQHKNLISKDIPSPLLRRFDLIKSTIPKVIKYYDVDEYNRLDFIDEVLHQVYDEIDYDDVNTFFDYIKPLFYEEIGKIYDRKVSFRLKRRK
jgi:hypothetical protein